MNHCGHERSSWQVRSGMSVSGRPAAAQQPSAAPWGRRVRLPACLVLQASQVGGAATGGHLAQGARDPASAGAGAARVAGAEGQRRAGRLQLQPASTRGSTAQAHNRLLARAVLPFFTATATAGGGRADRSGRRQGRRLAGRRQAALAAGQASGLVRSSQRGGPTGRGELHGDGLDDLRRMKGGRTGCTVGGLSSTRRAAAAPLLPPSRLRARLEVAAGLERRGVGQQRHGLALGHQASGVGGLVALTGMKPYCCSSGAL